LVSLDQKIYTSDIGHFDGGHYGSGTALTITFYDHPLEG
jgi:hypothetical protein